MYKRLSDDQKLRIKYFRKLAKELPKDLEEREMLVELYMKHIENIKKEKSY
jgi:hypothetical protein